MLPVSVDPRAKMKVIARQGPSSSLLVLLPNPNWRFSRFVVGRAAALAARLAMKEYEYFIVVVVR